MRPKEDRGGLGCFPLLFSTVSLETVLSHWSWNLYAVLDWLAGHPPPPAPSLSLLGLSAYTTVGIFLKQGSAQKPSEKRRCHQWTKVRLVTERPWSWVQFVFSVYGVKPQGGAVKQGDFTEASVAVSRLLRATADWFSYFSRSFCVRKRVKSCLANRQYEQCFK